ncbi:MAG TPA: hypothetical protein VHY37_05395 [Tepidisphaeraceae bacterium]|nr:hypothetical protein [Tepidisphaeraceae bacterium]
MAVVVVAAVVIDAIVAVAVEVDPVTTVAAVLVTTVWDREVEADEEAELTTTAAATAEVAAGEALQERSWRGSSASITNSPAMTRSIE